MTDQEPTSPVSPVSREEGERHYQKDAGVAHDAAHELKYAVADPESLVTEKIYRNRDALDAFLEAAERTAKKRQLDGLLSELGVFDTRSMEQIVITEALREKNNRQGAPHGIVMLLADVDGLKLVNDALGHGVGNQLIFRVVAALRRVLRETDIVGRFGGDEVVAYLPMPAEDEKGAEIVMNRERTDDSTKTPGIIQLFQQELHELSTKLEEAYGDRWPRGTSQKQPGKASVGWHFFSRDEFLERFEEYLASDQEEKLFITFLTREADANMYRTKGEKSLPPDVPPGIASS